MICHNCGMQINKTYPMKEMVASDCQPVRENLALGACPECELMQKDTGPVWQACCDAIYKNYNIYHQGMGEEQKVQNKKTKEFKPRSQVLVDFLGDHIDAGKPGSVADIGCGNGAFLKAFQAVHPGWNLYGAELNEAMKPEIEAIGPNVHFVSSHDFASIEEKFDILTMIHCLEHIPAPAAYLQGLKSIMHDESVIMIQVPDAKLNPFDLLIADHSSHFSKDALRCIVEKAGFEVMESGNLILGKEITLVARPLPETTTKETKITRDSEAILDRNMKWIERVQDQFLNLARQKPVGIFGSSIAASWLASQEADAIAFFVDEDKNRVGRDHMGKKIIAPESVSEGQVVFLPLEPNLARTIAEKLKTLPVEWVVPPLVN